MDPAGDDYISICKNSDKSSAQCFSVFYLYGGRILSVLSLCIGIPAKDIYDGVGHIFFYFADTCVYMLACEGKWYHCRPDIRLYPWSVILTGIFDHAGILCDSPARGYNVADRRHRFDQETQRNSAGIGVIIGGSICVSVVYTLLGIVSTQRK